MPTPQKAMNLWEAFWSLEACCRTGWRGPVSSSSSHVPAMMWAVIFYLAAVLCKAEGPVNCGWKPLKPWTRITPFSHKLIAFQICVTVMERKEEKAPIPFLFSCKWISQATSVSGLFNHCHCDMLYLPSCCLRPVNNVLSKCKNVWPVTSTAILNPMGPIALGLTLGLIDQIQLFLG